MQNCICSQLDRSGIPKFGQNPVKFKKVLNLLINLNVGLYAHIEIVVTFLVVNIFGFSVITWHHELGF